MNEPIDGRMRLQPGKVIGGEIIIEGELGAGGFGITYKGRDRVLGRTLAVKEYFPLDIGNRDHTMSVHPVSESMGQIFRWGLDNFIKEAKILAGLKHPGIVSVFRYFAENDTAYMVLDFVEGRPMGRWLDQLGRPPTEAEIDRIVQTLCDVLETIHASDIVHRDIAPDNIIIRSDGSPVLLDFGAARQDLAVARREQSRVAHSASFAIVKRSYSPFEAYANDKSGRGPWSDIYSLGATLYRAVTGKAPPDAMDRLAAGDDTMIPASIAAKGRYRASLLAAIDRALALRRQDRIQTARDFRAQAFSSDATLTAPQRTLADARTVMPLVHQSHANVQTLLTPPPVDDKSGWRDIHTPPPPVAKPRRSGLALGISAVVVAVGLAAGIGAYAGGWRGPDWMFPGRQVELQRVAAFASQRRDVEGVVSQLRNALDEGRKAGDAREWARMRTMVVNAETMTGQARTAANRLKELSKTPQETAAADTLTRDIDALARRVADMRTQVNQAEENDRKQRLDREQQERLARERQERERLERERQVQDRDTEQRLARLDKIETSEDDNQRLDRELGEKLARIERVQTN